MKQILSYLLIISLLLSIAPFGLSFSIPEELTISLSSKASKVEFSETYIDMSTACKPAYMICKVVSFLRKIKARLIERLEYTTTVSGKLTELKGTKYRKIITFESDGDPDAGSTDNYRYLY